MIDIDIDIDIGIYHFYDGIMISRVEFDGTLKLANGRVVTRKEQVRAEKDLHEKFLMLAVRI